MGSVGRRACKSCRNFNALYWHCPTAISNNWSHWSVALSSGLNRIISKSHSHTYIYLFVLYMNVRTSYIYEHVIPFRIQYQTENGAFPSLSFFRWHMKNIQIECGFTSTHFFNRIYIYFLIYIFVCHFQFNAVFRLILFWTRRINTFSYSIQHDIVFDSLVPCDKGLYYRLN